VPPAQLDAFVEQIRPLIRRARADLLNVTVRDERQDDDTLLRYADRDLLALVMLFHHPRTPKGDTDMQSLTRELIDAALRCGGRYYLPYRLHATDAQFHAAYPQAERFFALKKRYDPDGAFQNTFYLRYALHPDR
jgi:FAD/FMN-containing dehydrogenase